MGDVVGCTKKKRHLQAAQTHTWAGGPAALPFCLLHTHCSTHMNKRVTTDILRHILASVHALRGEHTHAGTGRCVHLSPLSLPPGFPVRWNRQDMAWTGWGCIWEKVQNSKTLISFCSSHPCKSGCSFILQALHTFFGD